MDWGRLAYLVLLLLAVGGWVIVQNRQTLGKTAKQAVAWVLIFLGAILAVGIWDDIRVSTFPRQSVIEGASQIELPRARDGHYYMVLSIDGTAVEFMVDTGASEMVLTRHDAARVGIDLDRLDYYGTAYTANGRVRTAPIRLQRVEAGPFVDGNVSAWVNEGEMDQSLLGMSYLRRWSRIEITGDALVLTR